MIGRDGTRKDGPWPIAAFTPPADRRPCRHPFNGVLAIDGSPLAASDASAHADFALGGGVTRFPGVSLAFRTDGDGLLPVHRGLHRRPDPQSYWDIMVGEGCIWRGEGACDIASFPFQLSCERENDSHHGVARFAWDGARVCDLVVQVVTETLPDHVPERLDLWGVAEASFREAAGPLAAPDRHDPMPIHDISEIAPEDMLEALLDDPMRESEITSGLVIDGHIYTTGFATRHGPYPFPHAMRFGIWSATKAAFATTALMRLAHHLGPGVAETRIVDVLDVTADHDGWRDVTIRHCLSMATGIGTAGETGDIHADNLTGPEYASADGRDGACYRAYQSWYAARSRADKLRESFRVPSYPWGPGIVARYRDQDLFVAGAAMDAVWKHNCGPDADLFAMVEHEVLRPIGCGPVDINRTLEEDGARGVPVTAFGLFLGLDDVGRLGRLLSNGGRHEGTQLLEPSLVRECLDGAMTKGLPTGTATADGNDITYHLAWWQLPLVTRSGRTMRIATMRGYGGQIIQPLANGITCFRFAHDSASSQDRYDALMLPRLADALRAL